MSEESTAAVGARAAIAKAGDVFDELVELAMDVGRRSPDDHAQVFDALFAGQRPVAIMLRDFAVQGDALEALFSSMRSDPITDTKYPSESWHGLLAMWAGRAFAYARAYSGPLRRRLLGDDAKMEDLPPRGVTAAGLLSDVRTARMKSPRDRRYAEMAGELESFAGKMLEALEGFLAEGPRIRKGLRMEARFHERGGSSNRGEAASMATPEDVPPDLRVSFDEALAGMPAYRLAPTSRRTLQRWMKKNAKVLGVVRDADPSAQRPLVKGLRILQANPRRKTKPPQARRKRSSE